MRIAKITLRNDDLSRARFFERKSAQSSRAAGKETLAYRQQSVEIVDVAVAILVANIKKPRDADRQVRREHRVPCRVNFVICVIRRKKSHERSVTAQSFCRPTEIRGQIMAPGRICLVVTTDLATANVFFFSGNRAGQTPLTAFARVDDKRSAKTREAHHLIRYQDVLNQKTFDIAQAHVFVRVTEEDNTPLFLTKHTLRLNLEGETIDLRIAHLISKLVDRVSMLV